MVHIWVGKLALDKAISSELMEVIGPRQLRERLKAWFLYSPINMKGLSNPRSYCMRESWLVISWSRRRRCSSGCCGLAR
jgi:hypothetical protein